MAWAWGLKQNSSRKANYINASNKFTSQHKEKEYPDYIIQKGKKKLILLTGILFLKIKLLHNWELPHGQLIFLIFHMLLYGFYINTTMLCQIFLHVITNVGTKIKINKICIVMVLKDTSVITF